MTGMFPVLAHLVLLTAALDFRLSPYSLVLVFPLPRQWVPFLCCSRLRSSLSRTCKFSILSVSHCYIVVPRRHSRTSQLHSHARTLFSMSRLQIDMTIL